MKIRCVNCKRKFNVEINDSGIPKRDICDKCRSKELERELFSEISNKGKKKKNWWR